MHFNFRYLHSQSAIMLFLLFSVALHFPGDWRNTKVLTRVNTMTRNTTTRWSILPRITKAPKGNLDIPVIRVTAKFKTAFFPSFPGLSLFRQNLLLHFFLQNLFSRDLLVKHFATQIRLKMLLFLHYFKILKKHSINLREIYLITNL